MAIYKMIRKQVIPADIATLWDFFKDPSNLTAITPSYMNFVIKTMDTSDDIYAGQMITYSVAPIAKIPLFWMTEITAVENVPEIAKIYQEFFPKDKVIIADAHQYLLEHFEEFDFIWS
jgi:ligand-binding SRPBCC domain-containing protein